MKAIFKNKGLRRFPKNYRPVSLVIMLFKLFDFILLKRFTNWFFPHDNQTAYQKGRSANDHVFLIRCLIEQSKKKKIRLFFAAIDFDGAFDRVKRSILLKKLVLFGCGVAFVTSIGNMYRYSKCNIFGSNIETSYYLYSGIKQGLPLSPLLFLFYINDIQDYFDVFFAKVTNILEKLHILVHADDLTVVALSRDLMMKKIKISLSYCRINDIKIQESKCKFIVINGKDDDRNPIPFVDGSTIKVSNNLDILGVFISENNKEDNTNHMKKRYHNVIKFCNYLKENKYAPLCVKLKVLDSCVISTLLYGCETFGNSIPDGLEEIYFKLVKAAMGVRSNVPNYLSIIEAGMLPLKSLIWSRQLNYFRRFRHSLQENSIRKKLFEDLILQPSPYLQHYLYLDENYENSKRIYEEHINKLKNEIRMKNDEDLHYKF